MKCTLPPEEKQLYFQKKILVAIHAYEFARFREHGGGLPSRGCGQCPHRMVIFRGRMWKHNGYFTHNTVHGYKTLRQVRQADRAKRCGIVESKGDILEADVNSTTQGNIWDGFFHPPKPTRPCPALTLPEAGRRADQKPGLPWTASIAGFFLPTENIRRSLGNIPRHRRRIPIVRIIRIIFGQVILFTLPQILIIMATVNDLGNKRL